MAKRNRKRIIRVIGRDQNLVVVDIMECEQRKGASWNARKMKKWILSFGQAIQTTVERCIC